LDFGARTLGGRDSRDVIFSSRAGRGRRGFGLFIKTQVGPDQAGSGR